MTDNTEGKPFALARGRRKLLRCPALVIIVFVLIVWYFSFLWAPCLKWQCHDIFWHFLFYQSNPSGPLINRLKWFSLKIHYRGVIREISDSSQANIARSFAGINFVFCFDREYWIFKKSRETIGTTWVSLSNISNTFRENEFLRETILTCLTEAQMGWINEIKKC